MDKTSFTSVLIKFRIVKKIIFAPAQKKEKAKVEVVQVKNTKKVKKLVISEE